MGMGWLLESRKISAVLKHICTIKTIFNAESILVLLFSMHFCGQVGKICWDVPLEEEM